MRERGLRVTRDRLGVLDAFRRAQRPLFHREVMDALPAGTDRATVYRTLNTLEEEGIIHRAFLDGRSAAWELEERCRESHCHPHFSCRGCGETTCLEGVTVSTAGAGAAGLLVERRKVLLEGLCRKCR